MRMFPCGFTSLSAEDPGEVYEPTALDVSADAWAFGNTRFRAQVSLLVAG